MSFLEAQSRTTLFEPPDVARQMTVKGGVLSDVLFVPEPFRAADKAAIEQRRALALSPALPPVSGPRQLMVLVGEVKDISPARTGHRLSVKHMPDFQFMMDEELHRRLQARLESEIMLWGADEASHLMDRDLRSDPDRIGRR